MTCHTTAARTLGRFKSFKKYLKYPAMNKTKNKTKQKTKQNKKQNKKQKTKNPDTRNTI